MHPPLKVYWPILAIVHAILAQPTPNSPNTTLPLVTPNTTTPRLLLTNYGRDDFTTSGAYQILLCGAGQPDSKAAKLQALLPLIWQNLQVVIHDIKTGTASPHGYAAFFKTDASRAAVTDVFQKISRGDPVSVSADRAMRLGKTTSPPSFACLEESDTFTAHLYAECLAGNTGTRHTPLLTWGATEIVMICPSFWNLPPGLTSASCPRVVGNRAVPNDEALVRSMYATVVHMLAHVYVPESLDWGNSVVDKVDNVQDAIELDAGASLVNANSYALYASAVQAGCTDWPVVSQCEAQGTCAWPSS